MKVSDIDAPLIPASVPKFFIRDVPLEEIERIFPQADSEDAEANQNTNLRIFTDLICDENGDALEDVTEADDLKRIPLGIFEALMGDVIGMYSNMGKRLRAIGRDE